MVNTAEKPRLSRQLLESLSTAMLQVANARGLGIILPESTTNLPGSLHHLLALTANGSFTTAGGIGLIFYFSLVAGFQAITKASQQWQFIIRIVKNWLTLSIIIAAVLYTVILLTNVAISLSDLLYLYSNHHINNNQGMSGVMLFLQMIAIFGGRTSFIFAGFLALEKQKNASGPL
jgi:hypothetical protein